MKRDHVLYRLKQHTPKILGSERFSKYAVMIPLIQKENEIHVLFEVRSLELRRQPGEICFPGGRIDPMDKDEQDAAVRETTEELGITLKDISDVHPLDYMIPSFSMIVYPFVGFIESSDRISANPAEVGEIFTVPLEFLLNYKPDIYRVHLKAEPEEDFPFSLIPGGENYKFRAREIEEYFYQYKGKTIWGLTARILAHFLELMR